MVVRYCKILSLFLLILIVFSTNTTVWAITDGTGPVIEDFVLEENGKTLIVGDSIHVSAKITDESGVTWANVQVHGSGTNGFKIDLAYDSDTDRWTGIYTITDTDKDGNYRFLWVEASDTKYNLATYSLQNYDDNYFVIINTGVDGTGPVIEDFVLEENGKTLTVDDSIHVSAKITDESGVTWANVQAHGSGTNGFKIDLAYDSDSDRWTGIYTITDTDKDGNYRFLWVEASDTKYNLATYSLQNYDDNYFVIINTGVDPIPTKPINVQIINITQSGRKQVPEDIVENQFSISLVIVDDENKNEYLSNVMKLTTEELKNWPNKTYSFEIPNNTPELKSGKQEIKVIGLPEYIYGTFPESHKYYLSYKAWINNKGNIEIYLIWSDESYQNPEPVFYPLPEDEIGAYWLKEDGTKEYLLFQTYDICMNYLGNDELCRGNERCFHKEIK